MIYRLSGKVEHVLPTSVVLDVNGVGYQVEMPLSDLCLIPVAGGEIKVWVYTHVREDILRLYGFRSLVQRSIFETLISINGVGPKVALAMLSTLDPAAIRSAAFEGRKEVFESVPGIGKRTAERILIELKPKLSKLVIGGTGQTVAEKAGGFAFEETGIDQQVFNDLRSALENFGFKKKTVDPIIEKLAADHQDAEFKDLMRMALVNLGPSSKSEERI